MSRQESVGRNLSIGKAEAGGSLVWGCPEMHSNLNANLSYTEIDPVTTTTTNNKQRRLFEKRAPGAEDMAQELKASAVFAENLSSVTSAHVGQAPTPTCVYINKYKVNLKKEIELVMVAHAYYDPNTNTMEVEAGRSKVLGRFGGSSSYL